MEKRKIFSGNISGSQTIKVENFAVGKLYFWSKKKSDLSIRVLVRTEEEGNNTCIPKNDLEFFKELSNYRQGYNRDMQTVIDLVNLKDGSGTETITDDEVMSLENNQNLQAVDIFTDEFFVIEIGAVHLQNGDILEIELSGNVENMMIIAEETEDTEHLFKYFVTKENQATLNNVESVFLVRDFNKIENMSNYYDVDIDLKSNDYSENLPLQAYSILQRCNMETEANSEIPMIEIFAAGGGAETVWLNKTGNRAEELRIFCIERVRDLKRLAKSQVKLMEKKAHSVEKLENSKPDVAKALRFEGTIEKAKYLKKGVENIKEHQEKKKIKSV
ncbi:MAG: hypothetical protein ACTSUT_15245 [Promethearchaeota archaeon]